MSFLCLREQPDFSYLYLIFPDDIVDKLTKLYKMPKIIFFRLVKSLENTKLAYTDPKLNYIKLYPHLLTHANLYIYILYFPK